MSEASRVVAVIPYNDREATEVFYAKLGFARAPGGEDYGEYVILTDADGAQLHLTQAPEGWLVKGKSPFGVYFLHRTRGGDRGAARG